jgi:hypothetical protein
MCAVSSLLGAVSSLLGAASAREWEVTSRSRGPGRGARRPRGVHVDYALVALRPVQRFTPQGEEGRDEAVRVLGLDRQRRQRERHSECEVIALGT